MLNTPSSFIFLRTFFLLLSHLRSFERYHLLYSKGNVHNMNLKRS